MTEAERPLVALGTGSVVVGGDVSGVVSTGANAQISLMLPREAFPPPAEVAAPAGTNNLHRLDTRFVGRDAELARLRATVTSGDLHVVHGLGGVGKSTLALRYGRDNGERHPLVWWVRAHDADSINNDLAALTTRLNPPLMRTGASAAQLAEWARSWLQAHHDWLLIYDDADDPGLIDKISGPLRRGSHLVTTRRATGWRGATSVLALSVFQPHETLTVFTAGGALPLEEQAVAVTLGEELGHLPLAVEQAAAYLEETRTSLSSYVDRLRADPTRMFSAAARGTDPHRTVAQVWLISVESVTERSSLAARLLDVIASFATEPLPRDVLYGVDADQSDVDEALGLLASYSLIQLDTERVEMHRLVQAVARGNSAGAWTQATRALAAAIPAAFESAFDLPAPDQWPWWRAVLPHIDWLRDTAPEIAGTDLARLLRVGGLFRNIHSHGRHVVAYLEQATTLLTREFDADHPDCLLAKRDLGWVSETAGDLDRATALYGEATEGFARVFGPTDEQTLTARVAAATLALRLNLDAAAEPTQRLTADCDQALGPQHRLTLVCHNGMAVVLMGQLQPKEALSHLEQVLPHLTDVFGATSVYTFVARANHAIAMASAGKRRQSRDVARQILAEAKNNFGAEDSWTYYLRAILATVYLLASRRKTALAEFDATMPHIEQVYGTGPEILELRMGHALALSLAGPPERARPAITEVIAQKETQLGPDHQEVMNLRACTVLMELRAGNQSQADEILAALAADVDRVFPPDDPRAKHIRDQLLGVRVYVLVGRFRRWLGRPFRRSGTT